MLDETRRLESGFAHPAQGDVVVVRLPGDIQPGYHRLTLVPAGSPSYANSLGTTIDVLPAGSAPCRVTPVLWPSVLVAGLHVPGFIGIVDVSSISFGNVRTGTAAGPIILRWRNSAGHTEQVTPLPLSTVEAQNFQVAWDCRRGRILTPRASCSAQVWFKPRVSAWLTASLRLVIRGHQPVTVLLNAQSGLPNLRPFQATVTFPTVVVGDNHSVHQVNFVSTSFQAFPPTIQHIWIDGPDAASFAVLPLDGSSLSGGVANTCVGTINVGNITPGCNLTVWYHPRHAGHLRATLMIADDAPDSPQRVQLEAVALPPPLPPPAPVRAMLPLLLSVPDGSAILSFEARSPTSGYCVSFPSTGNPVVGGICSYTRRGNRLLFHGDAATSEGLPFGQMSVSGSIDIVTGKGAVTVHTFPLAADNPAAALMSTDVTFSSMDAANTQQAHAVAYFVVQEIGASAWDTVYRLTAGSLRQALSPVAFAHRLTRLLPSGLGGGSLRDAQAHSESVHGRVAYTMPVQFSSGICTLHLAYDHAAWRLAALDCGSPAAHLP